MYKLLDGDEADNFVERRWFAASRAVNEMRIERDTLQHVVELAQSEQRDVSVRLAELEAICRALGDEIMVEHERPDRYEPERQSHSAA